MRKTREKLGALAAEAIFRRRAARLQSTCGWCGRSVGKDDPVFAVGAAVRPGIDLSAVQGRVIEVELPTAHKVILAGVANFDSDAKRDGSDFMFMTCSEKCGKSLKAAVSEDIAPVASART